MQKGNNDNLMRWNLVSDFVTKHQNAFDEFELMRIKNIMLYGDFPNDFHIDVIREICDEFGLIPDDENMYLAFLRELESEFDIKERNIIEVGGGLIPRLGRRINLAQTKGSITIYDPRLLDCYESTDKFRLRREKFSYKTNIEDADLIIGLMPCKGAEVLIDQAIENRIDFMVWLCEGGPHGDCYDFYEDEDEWLYSIISCASSGIERQEMGPLKKKYIKKFSTNYPIISSKKINS